MRWFVIVGMVLVIGACAGQGPDATSAVTLSGPSPAPTATLASAATATRAASPMTLASPTVALPAMPVGMQLA